MIKENKGREYAKLRGDKIGKNKRDDEKIMSILKRRSDILKGERTKDEEQRILKEERGEENKRKQRQKQKIWYGMVQFTI